MAKELAIYGKIGIDKQINDDLRVRATVSGYHNKQNHFGSLYEGDRAGSRFYLVMVPQSRLTEMSLLEIIVLQDVGHPDLRIKTIL